MSVSTFNHCWAKVILETLTRHKVQHLCLAPGSRSTPLTLAALQLQSEQRLQCHTHFDERGLGFFALGLAKATHTPVAIIVTSGTAAANLYPAIIEAKQTGTNLIVLSADRPEELINCGANQAIEQENIFAHYPIANINLPRPNRELSAKWLMSTLDHACLLQQQQTGVIHINVPFAEPLYLTEDTNVDNDPWLQPLQQLTTNQAWTNKINGKVEYTTDLKWQDWQQKKGIVVVGHLPPSQTNTITQWANKLGWVLITDIQSNTTASLPYADIWLANPTVQQKLHQANLIVQFGGKIISKRVTQFLSEFNGEYWLVDRSGKRLDPHHHRQTYFNVSIEQWLNAHPVAEKIKPWVLEPLALSQFCQGFISQQLGSELNEASLAHHLAEILPPDGALFLGNSLFIRLVDALGKLPDNYPVYTNRGASGIDGLIATAAGIAIGKNMPLVAMVGDLSALYDLNSLALLTKVQQSLLLFVINNSGGAIFDLLPVDQQAKTEYYRLAHHYRFEQSAAMFNLAYSAPKDWQTLKTEVAQALTRKQATIIEITSPPTAGSDHYKNLLEQITQATISR
ncbi:2-succinyl-5-enolpyruvyl-6-hydroxy-3-cyclohexene-1-carboxylic-acid synthase [Mergibacter septicus]|uniref:2-succinyl-5-enolpyruvyl-6-hydroxy-3- cyclohexene-1-carboxylic-acid synthase n=1 Tax=Mergibacter septicus TaxID=221402 RepID=UPI001178FAA1|nr:2-succinyl-5-enolpyruvyl-6-hydroxy-3-cyclohexene-1-carboxylic-acid synthase [Mergibacter septicus]AWX14141.1 2-succinyl-5-enolpyruvyl-6-hydroxy-3-cyclohexene-1-carboxylic-acid synthase [Mergibacter septicus]